MKILCLVSGLYRFWYHSTIFQNIPGIDTIYTTWTSSNPNGYAEAPVDPPPHVDKVYNLDDYYNQDHYGIDQRWPSLQILSHALAVKDFGKDYDVIIRARWDIKFHIIPDPQD